MAKNNKGLRIGNYRITPLGLIALAVILLAIAAIIVFGVVKPFGAADKTESEAPAVLELSAPADDIAEADDGAYSAYENNAKPVEAVTTPVPTAEPTPEPTPVPRTAKIRALGEIAAMTNVLNAAKQEDGSYDFSKMFTYISDSMGSADYTIADVEGSMGGTVDPVGDSLLITPPSMITALKECGVDMLNLANDHALDGYLADLMGTIQNCKDAGMDYIGAAASQEEKDTPKVVDINGIKVGFLSYTQSLNDMEKKSNAEAIQYGVNLISGSINPANDVQALRNAGAEAVVCCVSWGDMFERSVSKVQQAIAKVLINAGVDVIIGYNPHVVQPAMWIEMKDDEGNVVKHVLLMGSCGNFLSDCRMQYADSGVILEFTLTDKADGSGVEVVQPAYVPTYVWRNDNEDGTFDYWTIPVGKFTESQPAEMSYANVSRTKEVAAEIPAIIGDAAYCLTE